MTIPNLVMLKEYHPHAVIDMRYASERNLFGTIVSQETEPRLTAVAAQALRRIDTQLVQKGYRLVIWDAYRSQDLQNKLRNLKNDDRYVLKQSNHCQGMAVDVTLAYENGTLLDMGTDHDDFSDRAHPDSSQLTEPQRLNRVLLIYTMKAYGFHVWQYEWWHFDFVRSQ